MKKILFLLLCTVSIYSQTYQNPTYGTVTTKTNTESATATRMSVQETSGLINWLQPVNIPIPITPINYAPTAPTLGGHLLGIDNKFASVTATTAGVTTRVWFTADVSVVSATNYYATNPLGKGTLASAIQNVVNNDNVKTYFAQDLIGAPFASNMLFPAGVYAGNLSASTSPNSAQQRWTVELYKCNSAGTPIASGVTGAVVGSLGVTVVTILDSGLLTLADGSVTNVQVSGNVGTGGFSIATGERIRYHVSAEKVGTAGANITQSVYYGTSYNSYLDVPVTFDTNSVLNRSTVIGTTTTEALNNLYASIPINYSKIVYVNNTNPNSATIFDDENPPTVNDNALKTDVANFYVGTDASGWVYNSTSLNYVTKTVTSITSNFYLSGTTTDAGTTKTAQIYRTGNTGFGLSNPITKIHANNSVSGALTDVLTVGNGFINNNTEVGIFFSPSNLSDNSRGARISAINDGSNNVSLKFYTGTTSVTSKLTIDPSGNSVLTGTSTASSFIKSGGTSTQKLLANGSVDSNLVKITITTSTSITTATTDSNSVGQDGRHVVIDNGVNVINLTCNGGVTASYGKVGTGAITFVQGSGRTLVQLSGTAVFNGVAGSTATLWSNGTTDYLAITNY